MPEESHAARQGPIQEARVTQGRVRVGQGLTVGQGHIQERVTYRTGSHSRAGSHTGGQDDTVGQGHTQGRVRVGQGLTVGQGHTQDRVTQ